MANYYISIISRDGNQIYLSEVVELYNFEVDFNYEKFIKKNSDIDELEIQSVEIHIEGDDLKIRLVGSSLKKIRIYISSRFKERVKVQSINSENIDLKIDGIDIGQMNAIHSSLDIISSKIDCINYGCTHYIEKSKPLEEIDNHLKLFHVECKSLELFTSVNTITINNSEFKKIFMHNTGEQNIIDEFHINDGTNIVKFIINYSINYLKINDSEIYHFRSKSDVRIKDVDLDSTLINYPFNLNSKTFCVDTASIDVLKLLKKCAKNNSDSTLYKISGYKLAKLENKNTNSIIKWYLDRSVGYGFVPKKAWSFSFCVILLFGIVYFSIDSLEYFKDGNNFIFTEEGYKQLIINVKNSMYLSGMTFTTTGYGDIYPMNDINKMISIIEACIGVSILSLVIYSLTKTYVDK